MNTKQASSQLQKPLILVCNDDGIRSEGIAALAHAFQSVGDVWVVAPDRENSATSHSLSIHRPLRVERFDEQWLMVDGTPIDCVYLAIHHLLPRKPDLVVSGVNHGPNLGSDVIYSGTVAAAMEGHLCGCHSIAVSLVITEDHRLRKARHHFETAACVAAELGAHVLASPPEKPVLLNVNCPDVPRDEVRGIRAVALGRVGWQHAVLERVDPRGRGYYWIAGDRNDAPVDPHGDVAAVAEGFASVTPLTTDLTQFSGLDLATGLISGANYRSVV